MLNSKRNKKDGIFSLSRAWDKEKKTFTIFLSSLSHTVPSTLLILAECGTRITPNSVTMTSLAASLPVAQWLERPTGVREVMGSIPVGDSGFFFVPCS